MSKCHPRIVVLGELDELNSALGVLRARPLDNDLDAILGLVQQMLFDIGGELAIPGHRVIDDHDLVEVESQADTINAELPPLKEFVLPGGHPDAAWCHHCRTVARRLERHVIALREADEDAVNPVSQALINRLSDLLFVMARLINLRHEPRNLVDAKSGSVRERRTPDAGCWMPNEKRALLRYSPLSGAGQASGVALWKDCANRPTAHPAALH